MSDRVLRKIIKDYDARNLAHDIKNFGNQIKNMIYLAFKEKRGSQFSINRNRQEGFYPF